VTLTDDDDDDPRWCAGAICLRSGELRYAPDVCTISDV
jgi:hypothetical protein